MSDTLKALMIAMLLAGTGALAGCQDDDVGDEMEEAMDETGDAIEDAGDEAEDALN